MKYACIAATEEGARCRNFVDNPGEMCWLHQREKNGGKDVKVAPRPHTILVKFNINPSWNQRFQEAGIPLRTPSEWTLEEKHINHAHQFEREAYRYRDIADAGVPVFGEEGMQEVSISKLFSELQDNGYLPQGVHIRARKEKKFDILVIPFVLEAPANGSLPKKAVELLRDFLSLSCWGFVHIWANPPQPDGKVVHTVNLGHRKPDEIPQKSLRFDHGFWAVEPVTT